MWWDFASPAQELLLCVLFVSACNVWCGERWCLMSGEVQWCVLCDVVRLWCSFSWYFSYTSLCSLLSACNVWCGEMWCLLSGEMLWCVMCDVWCGEISLHRCNVMCAVWCGEISPLRPKNFFFAFSLFRLVMCDVVKCDVWCLVRCDDVCCVMCWDLAYPAQELGASTSSLCFLLSPIRRKN